MNPILEHLPLESEESFFAKAFDLPYFGTPWHYHPEYELVLVEKGRGKRFVGNAVSDFQDGDLSFLGSNLPHLYKNPAEYYAEDSSLRVKSVVIHFNDDFLGKNFLRLPQAKKLTALFSRAKQGLDIYGETKNQIIAILQKLLETSSLQRLIYLLEILNILADTTEYTFISDPGIIGSNKLESDRLDKIFQYILQNFQSEIKLEEMAELVHMTRTSFCRFFQERTKRTFYSFLIGIRLNHAAKLLAENDLSIVQIAYESGYSNLSNFNRQFKEKFAITPREYRKVYLRKNV